MYYGGFLIVKPVGFCEVTHFKGADKKNRKSDNERWLLVNFCVRVCVCV